MIPSARQLMDLTSFTQGYSGFRPDILKLIKSSPTNVLDIGCGAGLLAKEIKNKYPSCKVTGIEGNDDLLTKAKTHCNDVIKLDLNKVDTFELKKKFDLIIFADVLEHLQDSEKVLNHFSKNLENGGYIITSLPNIRHYSTFINVFLLGTWPRNSRGIHDKTHVRFFTRKDIVKLLKQSDLEIEKESRNVRLLESQSWTNIPGKLLDFWPFRPFFTFQYLHRSKKLETKIINKSNSIKSISS